jgi:hypothetical protein
MIWPLKYGKRSMRTGNDSRQRADDREQVIASGLLISEFHSLSSDF